MPRGDVVLGFAVPDADAGCAEEALRAAGFAVSYEASPEHDATGARLLTGTNCAGSENPDGDAQRRVQAEAEEAMRSRGDAVARR